MSFRNFQVDANVTESDLLKRSDGFLKRFVASFRQAAANGSFTFGPIKLQDAGLKRVHGIVTEIDARRLFYACGEDEMPRYAMQSLYEARKAIRDASKGVSDPEAGINRNHDGEQINHEGTWRFLHRRKK